MLLKNTREPFNEIGPFDEASETGANWIEYYKQHGYMEAGELMLVGDTGPELVDMSGGKIWDGLDKPKRGKKADQPPANLSDSALADALSEDAKE